MRKLGAITLHIIGLKYDLQLCFPVQECQLFSKSETGMRKSLTLTAGACLIKFYNLKLGGLSPALFIMVL